MGSQYDWTRVWYRYFYHPSLHIIYHSVIETHPCGRKGSANMKNSSFRQLGKILNKTIYIVPEINASLKFPSLVLYGKGNIGFLSLPYTNPLPKSHSILPMVVGPNPHRSIHPIKRFHPTLLLEI